VARSSAELADRIAQLLRGEGIPFAREVTIDGVAPDIFARAQDGRFLVMEAKSWEPNPPNVARARSQAAYYKGLTGAAASWVVLGDGPSDPEHGVISISDLPSALRQFAKGGWQEPKVGRRRPRREIFAAMPFEAAYDDTYFVAITQAAKRVGGVATRVDQDEFSGDIVQEIHRLIVSSAGVVVDLSEAKPNVMYEFGYAQGLSRPTALICSTDLRKLPFDVRNLNVIRYTKGRTHNLPEKLAARLRKVVPGLP
jgi:hypothetical protein